MSRDDQPAITGKIEALEGRLDLNSPPDFEAGDVAKRDLSRMRRRDDEPPILRKRGVAYRVVGLRKQEVACV